MKRFILLLLFADLTASTIYQLIDLFATNSAYDFAVIIFSPFIFLIPTACAVIVFLLIKESTALANPLWTAVLQAISLSMIYCTALFIWLLAEAALGSSGIRKLFNKEYGEYMLVALSQAIAIPIIDIILAHRSGSEKRDKE